MGGSWILEAFTVGSLSGPGWKSSPCSGEDPRGLEGWLVVTVTPGHLLASVASGYQPKIARRAHRVAATCQRPHCSSRRHVTRPKRCSPLSHLVALEGRTGPPCHGLPPQLQKRCVK